MRIRIFIPVLLVTFLIPVLAFAVDQETVDRMEFLLRQPEWDQWDDGVFDDQTLLEGLEALYYRSYDNDDEALTRSVIWAMGETGLTGFDTFLIDEMENEPVIAAYALGKVPSVDGIATLISFIDDEDVQVRDAVVWALGSIPYDDDMEDAKQDALDALYERLGVETEDWVIGDIEGAITLLETGVIIDTAFMEDED